MHRLNQPSPHTHTHTLRESSGMLNRVIQDSTACVLWRRSPWKAVNVVWIQDKNNTSFTFFFFFLNPHWWRRWHEMEIPCVEMQMGIYSCWVAVGQEVRAVVWQQEDCWFNPRAPPPRSVSRCPWARHHLTNCSWRVGCWHRRRCMNGWLWGNTVNYTRLWCRPSKQLPPLCVCNTWNTSPPFSVPPLKQKDNLHATTLHSCWMRTFSSQETEMQKTNIGWLGDTNANV